MANLNIDRNIAFMSNSLTGPFYASLNISHVVNGLCVVLGPFQTGLLRCRMACTGRKRWRRNYQLVRRTSHTEHVVKRGFVLTRGRK